MEEAVGNLAGERNAAGLKHRPAAGLAEKEGFEPSCPFQDNPISSRGRYNRFDTSPCHIKKSASGQFFRRSKPPTHCIGLGFECQLTDLAHFPRRFRKNSISISWHRSAMIPSYTVT
jgi:hypothetical protein